MTTIHGFASAGFEPVRAAFEANFERHGEVGASVAVFKDGQPIVDLWGGARDPDTGAPWDEDTVTWVASTTKGMTAVCANLLIQRGELDVDAPVASYWPEFKAEGKESIPVRWLLSHKAGLPVIDRRFSQEEVAAWDPVADGLAAQRPEWEPGTAHGYHGMTYGFLVGEVIRRVTGDRPSAYFAREVAAPLGLDAWIGLPDSVRPRMARVVHWEGGGDALGGPSDAAELLANSDEAVERMITAMSDPNSLFPRIAAFSDPPVDYTDPEWLRIEMPAATGITNARSLAKMYASLISEVDGVRLFTPATVAAATERQSDDTPDKVMGTPVHWGLGFQVSAASGAMLTPASFGHPGAGGSTGFADPGTGVSFGYVMNKMAEPYIVDRERKRIEINSGGPGKDLVEALRTCIR